MLGMSGRAPLKQEQVQEILLRGSFYNPAYSRYVSHGAFTYAPPVVNCDNCGASGLRMCVGYDKMDLCMACVAAADRILPAPTEPESTSPWVVRTPCVQTGWGGVDPRPNTEQPRIRAGWYPSYSPFYHAALTPFPTAPTEPYEHGLTQSSTSTSVPTLLPEPTRAEKIDAIKKIPGMRVDVAKHWLQGYGLELRVYRTPQEGALLPQSRKNVVVAQTDGDKIIGEGVFTKSM
jgi:hypothetical protein